MNFNSTPANQNLSNTQTGENRTLRPNPFQWLGAQIIFTHDVDGYYLSFNWFDPPNSELIPERILGKKMEECAFRPLKIIPYLDRIRQILITLTPEKFKVIFECQEECFLLELVITPILMPNGTATTVLVIGRHLGSRNDDQEDETDIFYDQMDSEHYSKLLSKIARNIRRTLVLSTICDQTVRGIGINLKLSRCLICLYCQSDPESNKILKIAAEYPSLTTTETIDLYQEPFLMQAIVTQEPIILDDQGLIVIATCHTKETNGIICLYQSSPVRAWRSSEIELIRELADQVGTAIAQATLYQKLEEAREQAETASKMKTEFLANTSHELRTPLNSIIGFLKLILDEMIDDREEELEFIQEAHTSALHLLNIINDILDISKIEAGRMKLELEEINLLEICEQTYKILSNQAKIKNLMLDFDWNKIYDQIFIYGNYQRLLQVMLNLVGNGIKFTHQGGVTVRMEIRKNKKIFNEREFPGMVEVIIVDTGIGVSLEKQHKLFQAFSQIDGSRTRQYGGTGLGLAISQKLIEKMGGGVNFYSMGEGLGSTVTFTIPLYREPVIRIPNYSKLGIDT